MARGEDAAASLRIEVAYGDAPRSVWRWCGALPAGTTVAQALQASGLFEAHRALDAAHCAVGVWGRKAAPDQALRDRDRVEVYRALKVDPKEARRLRYRQHLAALDARRKSKAP